MVLHSTLTGADSHEPKDIAGASADTVYIADGSGSGDWEKIREDSIDTSEILNINKSFIFVTYGDAASTGSVLVPFPASTDISKIIGVIGGAISGSTDVELTFRNSAGSSMGTITFTQSGSSKGDTETVSPSSNNSVSEDSWMEIEVTEAADSGSVEVTLMIEFTLT